MAMAADNGTLSRERYPYVQKILPFCPSALLTDEAVRIRHHHTPIPAAAEKGSPEGLVPLAPAAQARVQGRALPLAAQARGGAGALAARARVQGRALSLAAQTDVTAKFGAHESKNRGDRT